VPNKGTGLWTIGIGYAVAPWRAAPVVVEALCNLLYAALNITSCRITGHHIGSTNLAIIAYGSTIAVTRFIIGCGTITAIGTIAIAGVVAVNSCRPAIAVVGAIIANLNIRLNEPIAANCLLTYRRTNTFVVVQASTKVALFCALLNEAISTRCIET
jgi:hypothetical protein